MLVRFQHQAQSLGRLVMYENARRVRREEGSPPALARLERQIVSQDALQARDYLWKTYTAGSVRDEALMARLSLEDQLGKWAGSVQAYGYQRAHGGAGDPPSQALRDLRSLRQLKSWGPLADEWFESVPSKVTREPDEALYRGRRLLVKQGITRQDRVCPVRISTHNLCDIVGSFGSLAVHRHLGHPAVPVGTLLALHGFRRMGSVA